MRIWGVISSHHATDECVTQTHNFTGFLQVLISFYHLPLSILSYELNFKLSEKRAIKLFEMDMF